MAKLNFISRLKKGAEKLISQLIGKQEEPRVKPEAPRVKPESPVSRLTKEDILRQKLKPIVDLANARWSALDERNLRSLAISRAYEESNDRWGFNLDIMKDEYDIIAEATRARVFINDKTSTIKGAELYTQQESYLQYKGQFGNQYKNWENKFQGFNSKTISEEQARAAFAAYRRLEESEASRIMAYGSENTILAMYDIALKNNFSVNNLDDLTDLTEITRDLLDQELGEKRAQFDEAFEKENEVQFLLDAVNVDYLGREW